MHKAWVETGDEGEWIQKNWRRGVDQLYLPSVSMAGMEDERMTGEFYRRLVVAVTGEYHEYYQRVKDTLEEAAREWPIQKRGFWQMWVYEPLVDIGKVEAWYEKWFGVREGL